MKLIFLDTETTGNESKDRLCQLAYKEAGDGEKFSELFKPPLPIAIESSAVCHITNKMVADKPAFVDSPHFASVKKLLEDADREKEKNVSPADTARYAVAGLVNILSDKNDEENQLFEAMKGVILGARNSVLSWGEFKPKQ